MVTVHRRIERDRVGKGIGIRPGTAFFPAHFPTGYPVASDLVVHDGTYWALIF